MKREEIYHLLVQHICEVIPDLDHYDFKLDDRLQDLGANSVDRAEIIMLTMESLSLKIPRVELFGANNIGELVDLLFKKLQSS